jgi:hypothetical protein
LIPIILLISLLLPWTYIVPFVYFDTPRSTPSSTSARSDLLREYRILDQSVRQRENAHLFTGSFFVTASILLIGPAAQAAPAALRTDLIYASWALYSVWLFFFQLTGSRLTNRTYDRLRSIETQVGFNAHRFLVQQRDPLRRWIWLVLYDVLLGAGLALAGERSSVFLLSLGLQTGLLLIYYGGFAGRRYHAMPS